MPRTQPRSATRQPLRLLRDQIAGIENRATPGIPTSRVPLGHARLDRRLSGGLRRDALHEIVAARPGDHPAAAGFALALAARLRLAPKPIVWISEDFAASEWGAPYGPGLLRHGIDPQWLLLIHAASAKEALWAMEEALKCGASSAVIGEIFTAKFYDLAASRRLILAAQKQATPALLFFTGFAGADALSSGADTRFEIRARPSLRQESAGRRLPLPGSPAWSVRIAKARAGPAGLALDPTFHPVFWTEGQFSDALPLPLASVSADGSDRPSQQALAS